LSAANQWLIFVPCAKCGAPSRHLKEHLFAVCEFCGSISSSYQELQSHSTNLAAAATRTFVAPTLLDARRLELQDYKSTALQAIDRQAFLCAVLEHTALDSRDDASLGDVGRSRWVRWRAHVETIASFDLDGSFPPFSHADLRRDPRATVENMLAAYRQSYLAITCHRNFPVELIDVITPVTAAVDTAMVLLSAWAYWVPMATLSLALDAMGQQAISRCQRCRAALDATATQRLQCAYCRAPLQIRQHPLLHALDRTITLATLNYSRRRDYALALVQIMLGYQQNTRCVLPSSIVDRLLHRQQLFATDLDWIVTLLRHSTTDRDGVALLDHIEQCSQQFPNDPPSEEPFIFLPSNPVWARLQTRQWKQFESSVAIDQRGLAAVNQVMMPLATGFVLAIADAVDFFLNINVPLPEVLDALRLHSHGESNPVKARFFIDLTRAIDTLVAT
jgi:DNA-directed RNA polymerase subunit RPC12/RpoP